MSSSRISFSYFNYIKIPSPGFCMLNKANPSYKNSNSPYSLSHRVEFTTTIPGRKQKLVIFFLNLRPLVRHQPRFILTTILHNAQEFETHPVDSLQQHTPGILVDNNNSSHLVWDHSIPADIIADDADHLPKYGNNPIMFQNLNQPHQQYHKLRKYELEEQYRYFKRWGDNWQDILKKGENIKLHDDLNLISDDEDLIEDLYDDGLTRWERDHRDDLDYQARIESWQLQVQKLFEEHKALLGVERFGYFKYYKPVGVTMSKSRDAAGTFHVTQACGYKGPRQIKSVGGLLEFEDTGIVILTDDPRLDIALQQVHPQSGRENVYVISLNKVLSKNKKSKLNADLTYRPPRAPEMYKKNGARKRQMGMKTKIRPKQPSLVEALDESKSYRIKVHQQFQISLRDMVENLGRSKMYGLRITSVFGESMFGIGLDGMKPGDLAILNPKEMERVKRVLFDHVYEKVIPKKPKHRWDQDIEFLERQRELWAIAAKEHKIIGRNRLKPRYYDIQHVEKLWADLYPGE